jgi:two-component system, cell cycle sensor histidine kinase and response regulator CckA
VQRTQETEITAWSFSQLSALNSQLQGSGLDGSARTFLLSPVAAPLSSARVTAAKKRTRPVGRMTVDRILAAALRAQSEGVLVAENRRGPKGLKIIFANDSFCSMTGHAAEDLKGQWIGVLHTDRAEIQRLRRWLSRADENGPLEGEGLLVRVGQDAINAAWSYDPLFDSRRRLTHVVATFRDQTEKRRLEEALVHSQRLDAVGRLAGGVAHDFNNLLSVINGYCEMLAAHVVLNPQASREVAEIHNAGRAAAALTQQLLAFSRRQPLNAVVLNLNQLVRDNAEILRRLVGDSGRLEFELAEGLANVRTDPAQFQQVLLNLVLNARDALRDRGRIVVRTENRLVKLGPNRRRGDLAPGRYVVLAVQDNGTGMDAETQKHLFEPFFTTKPVGKGTGLGLALVYGVVQQSGGLVSARSRLLAGSTFEVLLPAIHAPVEESAARVAPLPSVRGTESVLLVEEDDVVRKMVAGILTADGYKVAAAPSFGAAARLKRPGGPVQLLIANLEGEGEKFARRLFRRQPDLRILLTSNFGPGKTVAWLPVARQRCLNKPFALSELVRATRNLLDA